MAADMSKKMSNLELEAEAIKHSKTRLHGSVRDCLNQAQVENSYGKKTAANIFKGLPSALLLNLISTPA